MTKTSLQRRVSIQHKARSPQMGDYPSEQAWLLAAIKYLSVGKVFGAEKAKYKTLLGAEGRKGFMMGYRYARNNLQYKKSYLFQQLADSQLENFTPKDVSKNKIGKKK